MANGQRDDGQSSTDQGQQNQPVPQSSGPSSGAQSGISGIDEGWGAGEATFDEVIDNVKTFFQSMQGPLLMAWLAYAGLTLLLQTFDIGLYFLAWAFGALGGIVSLILIPFSILVSLAYFAVTAGQLTLYGPMRERVLHGVDPDSWTAGIKEGLGRILPVLVALAAIGVLTSILSLCLFVPGLAFAFFTVMAPYLLATREEMPLGKGFTESYELSKKYWKIIAITIGALFAAGMVGGCFLGVGAGMAAFLPEPIGPIFSDLSMWLGTTLFQFGIFVVWGGVFTTVDAHESGETVQSASLDVDQEW